MKKILTGIFVSVVMVLGLAACSGPGASGPNIACTNKVIQELATDQTVTGVWNCMTPRFQKALRTYVESGMLISADDAIFTDGTNTARSVVGTKYVGSQNGVNVYTLVVKTKTGDALTLTVTFWVDSSGRVDNLNITGPLF